MSNPLNSLKRNKKPPLFLPEMPDASTSPTVGSSLSNYYSGYNAIPSQRRTSIASNSTEPNVTRKSFALKYFLFYLGHIILVFF